MFPMIDARVCRTQAEPRLLSTNQILAFTESRAANTDAEPRSAATKMRTVSRNLKLEVGSCITMITITKLYNKLTSN